MVGCVETPLFLCIVLLARTCVNPHTVPGGGVPSLGWGKGGREIQEDGGGQLLRIAAWP